MSQWTPGAIVSSAALVWLSALGAIVLWKLFTRAISLDGLLYGDRPDGETFFSPGRVQLLIATILLSVHLITQMMAHPTAFPKIPSEFLVALGGSHLVYLGGKARAMLR